MPTFSSYDGTVLSYRLEGNGPLLICVPGGPARDSRYLGDLGGLTAYRTLVLLDNRGTGESADAADPSDVESYRADRLCNRKRATSPGSTTPAFFTEALVGEQSR